MFPLKTRGEMGNLWKENLSTLEKAVAYEFYILIYQ